MIPERTERSCIALNAILRNYTAHSYVSEFQSFIVRHTNLIRGSKIGQIKGITWEVNLNADRKRLWLGQLGKIDEQFNESASISLTYFNKKEI